MRQICRYFLTSECTNPRCKFLHPVEFPVYIYTTPGIEVHPDELRLACSMSDEMCRDADNIWLNNYAMFCDVEGEKEVDIRECPDYFCMPFDIKRVGAEIENIKSAVQENRYGRTPVTDNRRPPYQGRGDDWSQNRGYRSEGWNSNRSSGFDSSQHRFDVQGGQQRYKEYNRCNEGYGRSAPGGGGYWNNYNSSNEYNRPPPRDGSYNDYNRPTGDYNRQSGGYNRPPPRDGSYNDYNRPPSDLNKPHSDYNRPPSDYNRPPGDFNRPQRNNDYNRQGNPEYRGNDRGYNYKPRFNESQGSYGQRSNYQQSENQSGWLSKGSSTAPNDGSFDRPQSKGNKNHEKNNSPDYEYRNVPYDYK